jgi:hypothetical protein
VTEAIEILCSHYGDVDWIAEGQKLARKHIKDIPPSSYQNMLSYFRANYEELVKLVGEYKGGGA